MQADVALIKGSSIVAEIIDLGTAGATGGSAFVAAAAGISGLGRVAGQELAYEAGESLRHLIGKRHHAS